MAFSVCWPCTTCFFCHLGHDQRELSWQTSELRTNVLGQYPTHYNCGSNKRQVETVEHSNSVGQAAQETYASHASHAKRESSRNRTAIL